MSSYVSGVYEISEAIRDQIRAQARRELEVLNSIRAESAANEAAHQALLNQRAASEANRQQQEARSNQNARNMQLSEQERRQELQKEADRLLAEAGRRIELMDDGINAKESLAEKLSCIRDSVALFGVTESNVETIRQFAQVTVPETLARALAEEESMRLEVEASQRLRVTGAVLDQSSDFVSLKVSKQMQQTAERPWELFVKRLKALSVHQDELGIEGIEELLEELEGVAPGQQNLFMLRYAAQLEDWEAEAQGLLEHAEAQQERYQAYCTLRQACSAFAGEIPLLDASTPTVTLEAEHERLMAMYLEYQNQRYLEKNFREVFEANGLTFESMQANQEALQIEFSMDHENSVRVARSASGAFEMVFVSHAAAESLDQRRRATEKAHSFCSLMPGIYEELAERGIRFDQRYVQAPAAEQIVFEQRAQTAHHHQKKQQALMN